MRYVLAHKGAYPIKPSVQDLIEKEMAQGYINCILRLFCKVKKSREDLVDF